MAPLKIVVKVYWMATMLHQVAMTKKRMERLPVMAVMTVMTVATIITKEKIMVIIIRMR